MVVDVVTEFAREGALSELLYADDLIVMSETIEGLKNKFLKWKESFEGMCLGVSLGKTNVSGNITHNGLSRSEHDPRGVLRVNTDSVLCAQF